MQLDLFGCVQRGSVGLDELFAAYLECRRNKRRTTNALAFEVDARALDCLYCNRTGAA